MMVRLARCAALLALVSASLTACAEGPPQAQELRRDDVARSTTGEVPVNNDATIESGGATDSGRHDAAPTTAAAEPEPRTTDDQESENHDGPTELIDWRNTTFRMRAYSGSDLEDLAFTDGVADTTVIVAVKGDPTNPRRVAMVSTSSDSEGYPLFVNAGFFTLDPTSGVAMPEAETSTMTGLAFQIHLCSATPTWDGGEELTLPYEACEGLDSGSLRWTREGSTLVLQESNTTGEDGGGPGTDAGNTRDVTSYGEVHFSSPSGAISCTMNAKNGGWAACHFPPEMDQTGLPGPDHCGHTTLAGVGVGREVGWICSGGAFALPNVSTPFTAWFEGSGWEPAISGDPGYETTTAAVPYGATLVLGDVRCRSTEDGMHCSHTASGAGFSLARAGVHRTGPLTETFTELWD